MDYLNFTPFLSLAGGALIGLAASILFITNGRIAGVSGIYGSALTGLSKAGDWRWFFLAGVLTAGALLFVLVPTAFGSTLDRPLWSIAVAGLLVGLGTRYGSGCTSGHGVCGMSRLSRRSLVATAIFLATGGITATLARIFFAGTP